MTRFQPWKTLAAAGLLLATAAAGLAQAAAPAHKASAKAPSKAATPQARKETPPPPAPAKEIHFPAFEQRTLPNGLRVVIIEQHDQPLVSLRMILDAGKAYEPAGKSGLAEATSSLLTKGTPTRTAQQIAETIDFVGGNLAANTGTEAAYAGSAVTSDQIDLGFDLLSDVVLHPTFPQDELERWRRQALSNLQIQQKRAGYLADTALRRLIFGDYPYGRPTAGTPQSLAGLTRDDLIAFHQRFWVPNGTILAVVGDVKPVDAFARAERAFGGWKKGEAARLPDFDAPKPVKTRVVVIDKTDAVQTEIRLGEVGIAYRDPALYTAEVYNSVLGGSPSARLYEEIRRKRGLSYGANSTFQEETQPGFFEVSTFTKTESTVEVLGLAFDVLRALQQQPVPESELRPAKTFLTGAFPLEIETAEGIAARVLQAMHFGYGREFLESYDDNLSKVSAAELQRFAREKTHPDRMTVVLAGNAAVFSEALKKKFGDVEIIPAADVDFLQPDLRKPKATATAAPAPATADPAGRELVRKAQQALGGQTFVEQKSQISKGSGSMTPPGAPQPMAIASVVSYRMLPDKDRTEIQLPMGTMIQGFDGSQGWMSLGAQSQDTTEQAREKELYGLDVLRRAGQADYTARLLPDAEVNGKPAKVVEVADAQGHATRFFLDPQTSLVTKIAFELNGQLSEAAYSDYRDVQGVKIAHQVNIFQNGQPLLEIKYSDVQVNAPVDAKLFQKPQG
ncbi:MAG TPA: insulinase family protein [Thermoanaerobaculia bacterium]|jgi:zinc protease